MDYKQIIQEYHNIYLKHYEMGKVYGKSSEDLLRILSPHVIKLNPHSIIDYGCGRSCLINYFWNDGKRALFKYDPAIRELRHLQKLNYGLVICTDVLEHIPLDAIPIVLKELCSLSQNTIIGVSLIPARQKLSDGTNAHVTILSKSEWMGKILDAGFTRTKTIKIDENGLLIKTW